MHFRTYSIAFLLAIAFLFLQASHVQAFTVSKPNAANNLGLVAWWTMDGVDLIGGLVRDKSGNANHGSQTNMATATAYATGKIGQALNFDGVDDSINLGDNTVLDIGTSNFSISMWIKRNQQGTRYLLGKTNGSLTGAHYYIRSLNGGSTGIIEVGLQDASSNAASPQFDRVPPDDQWHNLVVTVDRSNASGIKLYLDGVQKTCSGNCSYTLTSVGDLSNTNTLGIGSRVGSGGSGFYVGLIDDVRLYNRVLSATEVLALYMQGLGTKQGAGKKSTVESGLTAYYTFDGVDMPQGLARDISGNGNHGSLTNMATATSRATGKIGQALNFDSAAGAKITTTSDYIGTNPTTASAWVYARSLGGNSNASIVENRKFIFSISTFGRVTVTSDALTTALSATNAIALNQWNHVAVTRDASGTANFYINGTLNGTANQSSGTPTAGTTNVIIGNANSIGRAWDGLIDDVRVYNRVLSTSEIQQLYNTASSTAATTPRNNANTQNGLVGHWTFDGKDMITGLARDISGSGNHGSLTNMATATSRATGKLGQALSFDGVNDNISTGSDFIGTSALTVSAWIKANDLAAGAPRIIDNAKTRLSLTTSGRFSFASDGATAVNSAVLAYSFGQWVHVAVTRDSSGVTNFYVNGVINGTANQSSGTPTAGTTNVYIGGVQSPTSNPFSGIIDDLRVYNRVLSAAEVLTLYNQGR